MRIWSILLIQYDLKWCIVLNLSRNPFLYFMFSLMFIMYNLLHAYICYLLWERFKNLSLEWKLNSRAASIHVCDKWKFVSIHGLSYKYTPTSLERLGTTVRLSVPLSACLHLVQAWLFTPIVGSGLYIKRDFYQDVYLFHTIVFNYPILHHDLNLNLTQGHVSKVTTTCMYTQNQHRYPGDNSLLPFCI